MKQIIMILFLIFISTGLVLADTSELISDANKSQIVEKLLLKMKQKNVSQKDRAHVLTTIAQYQQKGVPDGPLADKVNEGLAKNVPMGRIVTALGKVGERYQYVSNVSEKLQIKEEYKSKVIKNFVHALASGVSRSDVGGLIQVMSTSKGSTEKIESYSSMIKTASRLGIPSAEVRELSIACIDKNLDVDEILSIQKSLRVSGKYIDSSDLASRYRNAIEKGYRHSDLNEALQNISNPNYSDHGESKSAKTGSAGNSVGNGNGNGNGSGSGKHSQ